MTCGRGPLRSLDRIIWLTIAAAAAFVVVAGTLAHFTIVWKTSFMLCVGCVVLAAGATYYAYYRNDLVLASSLQCTAQVCAFTAVGESLSYLAASANLPLRDALFARLDRSLPLDWHGLLAWMNAHPLLHWLFWGAYLSFPTQVIMTVVMLGFSGQLKRLRVFVLAFMITAIVSVAISAVLPAQGVWGYFGLTPADYPDIVPVTRTLHLHEFFGLRDGSYRLLMSPTSQGIVTFPSFHAGLAVIFIVALWSVPIVRWVGLALNVTMIVATPIDGGHYFVDVLAGIAIAAIVWRACCLLVDRVLRERVLAQPLVTTPGLVAGE